MKTIYIDCSMGAAGDMLSAALLDLMPEKEAALDRLNSFGLKGVKYSLERVSRCGIAASRLVVTVNGEEEGAAHDHHEAPHHVQHAHHHHHHHGLNDILNIIESLELPRDVKANASAVYRLLADAESKAHGRPVGEVHFHEVGAMDAVADITAACWLISELAADEIVASPVNVGAGSVQCAHGTLSVPAPATAALLSGVPSFGDTDIKSELCTPTGAALVKTFAKRFGPQPAMTVSAVGYGAGKKDFTFKANILRCSVGESAEETSENDVVEIKCNIDDMTGEDAAFACEEIFKSGALDVVTIPAIMKKGRPGIVLAALCEPKCRQAVIEAIFRHTTTLGIRESLCRRTVLKRRTEEITLKDGSVVRCKVAQLPDGSVRSKPEHDDIAALSRQSGRSLSEIRSLL